MTKQAQLDELTRQIIANNTCLELASQATQLVVGEGNLNSDIVLIGEAPGKKEDETGQPFMGAAGRFLNKMLDAAGMQRSDVYITNIVKYRPPNNRDPSTAEKEAFMPFLQQQITIIAPKIIVTLGRHSMEMFLPGIKISEIHGQPQSALIGGKGYSILPLYHPAAALYNGKMRQTLIDDFKRIPKLISSLEMHEV